MYLVSIYFDEKTNKIIQKHIESVAGKTGNTFMLGGKIPPHITIASFNSKDEKAIPEALDTVISKLTTGSLTWASIGAFLPHVIYLTPVLNEYLHTLSTTIHNTLKDLPDTIISPYYTPFNWLPHTTIAKQLTPEELLTAFTTLQTSFSPLKGQVTQIGLAQSNPYKDIKIWQLIDEASFSNT